MPIARDSHEGWEKVVIVLTAGFRFFEENPSYVRLMRREALDGGAHLEGLDLAVALQPLFDEAVGFLEKEMRRGHVPRATIPASCWSPATAHCSRYFSDAPFLGGLLGADPLSPEMLRQRLDHVLDFFRAAAAAAVGCAAMPSVQVGAVEVAYGVEGEGAPLVLVHGTTQSSGGLAPAGAAAGTHVRGDHAGAPGLGRDPRPGGALEVADLAHQMVAVADALGHERFHLAGYSLGAVVAAEAAAQVSARVRSLTLLCGWATTDARMRFTFDLWDRLLKADPELFARYAFADGFTVASFELFGSTIEELLPQMAASFAPGSDRQLELDQRVDIAHRLSAITAPTLVVGALDDRWVDVRALPRAGRADPDGAARGAALRPCGAVSEVVAEVSTMIAAHATGR